MKRYAWMAAFAAVVALLVTGCGGPQGRIKGEDEGSLVGAKKAGAATYNQLIEQTTQKLLDEHKARAKERTSKMLICFIDVENRSAEELGENKEAIYELIDTVIIESGTYANVSRRYVDAALRETGLRADEIFLAKGRSKFMAVLGREGVVPEYLLWGKTTTLSTGGSEINEREYMLTMEMVDAKTGMVDAKKTARVRKEYKR